MTAHCATCNCADDERPAQPATSSTWARRAAIDAAAAAVRAAKDARKKPATEETAP
jgi:hypothetical protein